ncbi:MAG: DNA polymerase III subunit alpha [Saprospiraceae bacterium]|nr:DNA polymerase III subunit alpha [Saprospiraceae bacterium]MBK8371978.1 DNA polymerase III subunit alpha [Saprospiraceae bacterium]MBK8818459.1 DNA polymerase III subunit alpha [Saprospiraceae bacterium]MBP6694388.1 DNA polymerase III subunit alpha [Saprospiraceae bacterium]
MVDFCHLHCHTQYSLLDGASDIKTMMNKAKADGQSAVAITDHGNMFGVFKFVKEAKQQGIKPIIGCEFYVAEDRFVKSFEKSRGQKDVRYHQLMLAKNQEGYKNLTKLASLGFTEGLYGKFPRIDKTLIEKYHHGIIATSCCIGAEIPQTILKGDIEGAEKKLKWWLDLFGEDYYIELQRHRGMEKIDDSGMSQEDVNQVLIGFAKKYNVKTIVTNDSHYVEEEDWAPHDVLLCINTGSLLEEKERFNFPSSDFYFKTKAEMNTLFGDVVEAVENTMDIAHKIQEFDLARDVLLPAFPLPTGFDSQELYLRHLTFVGAQKRYGLITPEIEERLNFELNVINHSGYPGYFLIVQDFTSAARHLGVSVGPGRGSAAGSAVAYCLGITNIDPIKYDLLFERFLNPERVSMPDIDIDFDDEGRSKVIDYVIDKYGKNQVAQIITYGTMAARMSLRDVGRVMNVPLNEVDRVTKTFPSHLSATLQAVLAQDDIDPKLKENLASDDIEKAYLFRKLAAQKDNIGNMITTAKKLEGAVRNTGIHACGVIITPGDITDYVPVSVAKDSELLVSQYDNSVAEEAGLLKMDFLGLKTLTIIKDALENVKERYGVDLDIDTISLEDLKTFELFQRGDMVGIFQYESPGMQKYLRDLKPTRFEDLIAMNALYRPGPLQYIPDFIARKNGKQTIAFDLPEMEEYLAETYGITVYQEQVMLLSQKLAGFSKGDADMLRKAMGKKQKAVLDKMLPKFIEGCTANGHPEEIVKKIWTDWEAFASYAFNKSHSTCYAYIAFQTAYLKSHFPAAFMASVLNHNKNDISKVNFYLQETKRMRIPVLGPDVNESNIKFTVNKNEAVRFGLSALKGVGEGPVEDLVAERNSNGPFSSIYDIMRRVNLRSVNKKCLDSLALSGAFDCFTEFNRAQYFAPNEKGENFVEQLIKFGSHVQGQKESIQISLFGEEMQDMILEPKPEKVQEWNQIEKLEKEREVTGIYISGHPLDDYTLEFNYFINCPLEKADQIEGQLLKMGGMVKDVHFGSTQKGNPYTRFTMVDFTGEFQISLYNESHEMWKHLISPGNVLYVEGINQKGLNSDRAFFRVKDIMFLDTVGQVRTKSITVKIALEDINENAVNSLVELCESKPGKHTLKFRVRDTEADMEVDLQSLTYKINADGLFVQELESLGFSFKLN